MPKKELFFVNRKSSDSAQCEGNAKGCTGDSKIVAENGETRIATCYNAKCRDIVRHEAARQEKARRSKARSKKTKGRSRSS